MPGRARYADHLTVGRPRGPRSRRCRRRRDPAPRRPHAHRPHRMRMRVLASMVVVPRARCWSCGPDRAKKDGKRAATELASLRRRDPAAVAFCHQSPGTCRSGGSCCSATRSGGSSRTSLGRWRLRYRTTTRRAIRRAEGDRAAPPVGPGPIGDLILDLHQWMTHFDAASVLELDYGELCDFQRVGRARRRPLLATSTSRSRRWKQASTRGRPTSTRGCSRTGPRCGAARS